MILISFSMVLVRCFNGVGELFNSSSKDFNGFGKVPVKCSTVLVKLFNGIDFWLSTKKEIANQCRNTNSAPNPEIEQPPHHTQHHQ